MNLYWYRLLLPEGITRVGLARIAVERDFSARLWLEKRHDAVVLSLWRAPHWLGEATRSVSGMSLRGITADELSGLLRDLSVMLTAGVPMFDALRTVAEESNLDGHVRAAGVARLLFDDLDAGMPVAEAFRRHPDIFPESVRNLVAIGDETGTIDRVLMEAAEHIERLNQIGRDTRRALIYPAFVFAAIIAAALFWTYYVIPNLAELFLQMNAKLPPLTLGVLAVADWIGDNATLTLSVLLAVTVGLWLAVRRSQRFRVIVHRLLHRMPITRTIARASGMAFITEHFALLIRAGLDMMTSLDVMARATRDEFYRQRLIAVRKVVARRARLAVAMREVGGFPPMAVRMIAVGEETGSVERQFEYLAGEYRRRLDHLIESLSEIIKPAVILLAGGLFVLLIVAFLLPVYDLVKQAMSAPMR
jgi:type II secretory pathway component PulF